MLDYWFIPHCLQTPETSMEIIPYPLSDHSILLLEVGPSTNQRAPGHWRFDNVLLGDTTFKDKMLQHITEVKEEELSDPHRQWEWIKYKIREFAIQYKTTVKRE